MEPRVIRARCPSCRNQAVVAEEDLGQSARCRHCSATFVLEPVSQEQADDAPPTLLETYLRCPRCPMMDLDPEAGELGEYRCPDCGGVHLPRSGVERFLRQHLSLEPEKLGQLRELSGGVARRALACPDCGESMASLNLRGVPLDSCEGCGNLWLDGGELFRLTNGRYGEPAPGRAAPGRAAPGRAAQGRAASTHEKPPGSIGPVWSPPGPAVAAAHPARARAVDPTARNALLIGALLAVVTFALPFPRFVMGYLGILVHELGHTLGAWAFGHPALPRFDFQFGGGVTSIGEQEGWCLLLIYAGFAALLWHLRFRPLWRGLAVVLIAIYSLAAFSSFPELFWLALGHGMELIMAGVFLYRVFGGQAVTSELERTLYAACAFFLLFEIIDLAWGLIYSATAREAYARCKGGLLDGDLTRLANEYLGVTVPEVARGLLLLALITPVVSVLVFRYGFVWREKLPA